jgi:hypothetical protein
VVTTIKYDDDDGDDALRTHGDDDDDGAADDAPWSRACAQPRATHDGAWLDPIT